MSVQPPLGPPPEAVERIDQPDGSYWIVVYRGPDGGYCPKAAAAEVEIGAYASDGTLLTTTWGTVEGGTVAR